MAATARSLSPGPLDPIPPAMAAHSENYEDADNTSSDGDGRGVEILVDTKHKMTSRRRRDSLANMGASELLAGLSPRSGCLLHALLDNERETRRRSLQWRRSSFIDGDSDIEEDGYISNPADSGSRPVRVPHRHSISPPPEITKDTTSSTGKTHYAIADKSQVQYSRALTKKQLAEMAFSVRDLSKYLGTLRIKMRVKKIIVVAKIWDKDTISKTAEFVDWMLEHQHPHQQFIIYVEQVLRDNSHFDSAKLTRDDPSRQDRLRYWNAELCREHPQMFDLVITVR